MESFDIIIIGAGPAGLNCAEKIGNTKYKVLILEKNSEIGPKICAGGLTDKSIEYLNLPKSLIDFNYNQIKVHVNKKISLVKSKDNFIYTVDRKILGQWQLEKLKKFKNIYIRKNSKVSKIEKDFILVNGKKISYKFLVGADGSSSIVKRYLGLNSKNIDVAIQYIIPTKKYKEFEIFFNSKLFSTWYAWIFPHKYYVSIGCGCDPKILPSDKLIQNFNKWIKDNKINITNGKYEAFMIDYGYNGHKFGNIFLAGDAAGLASGLTGEGIYQALVSGEEIAKSILDKNYESEKIKDLLETKIKHDKLMHFLISCGIFRTLIFHTGRMLVKIPYFKNKATNSLT